MKQPLSTCGYLNFNLTKIKEKNTLFPAELAIFQVPNYHVVIAATQLMNDAPLKIMPTS